MNDQTTKIDGVIKEIEPKPSSDPKPTVVKKARKRLIIMSPPVRAK